MRTERSCPNAAIFRAHAAPDLGEAPLLYAIGDIHGSLQKLRDLLTLCERHADGRAVSFIFPGVASASSSTPASIRTSRSARKATMI